MDFPPGFMDQILKYQKSPPSSRTKEPRLDLEIFSGLFDEVTKSTPLKDFMNKLMYCNNDDEKIDLIKPFFKWTPDSFTSRQFKKSSEMCLYFCNMTKEAPTMTECMKMVNMMFAFAADEGDLALANFMRFLYLSEGDDYIGALEAIKNVVKSPVLPKSHSLFQPPSREGVIAMETAAEKEVKESSGITIVEKSGAYKKEMEERKEFMKNLFTIKNPNPVAPSLEDFVEIKYNSSHGRHLVVTKDVPMGTTVLVESPAVAAPFQEPFKLGVVHCHYCFKKSFQLIPCPGCIFALFCDENCMNEAKNYHQYECAASPDVHSTVLGLCSIFGPESCMTKWIVVFKFISSLGPNRLFEIFQEEKKKKQDDSSKSKESSEIPGFHPVTKIYDPNSYETLCHLHHYFIKGSLFPSVAALCLTKILEMKSNFFDKLDMDSEKKLEFQDFLTKKMLYHFESFQLNSFSLDEVDSFEGIRLQDTKRKKNPVEVPEMTTKPVGQAIYPTASLFSHSCDPNILRFYNFSHGEVAFVAHRSLKKGEELCTTYGPHFPSSDKQARQESLDLYNFTCDCVACVENWPTGEELATMMMAKLNLSLNSRWSPFCCSRCFNDLKTKGEGNFVAEMKKRKMDWSKISLTPENGFKCASCNKKYSQASLISEYNGHEVNRMKIKSLLSKNNPLEALDLVKKASDFYQTNMIPPAVNSAMCVDTFIGVIPYIVHFSNEY